MKNRWLIDDRRTKNEVAEYILLMNGSPVLPVKDALNDDVLDFCIAHTIRHLNECHPDLASTFQAMEEDEHPEDLGLLVASYYRELKFHDNGIAVKPSHDWVKVYYSKDDENWESIISTIKEGAAEYASFVLTKNASRWNTWKKETENTWTWSE